MHPFFFPKKPGICSFLYGREMGVWFAPKSDIGGPPLSTSSTPGGGGKRGSWCPFLESTKGGERGHSFSRPPLKKRIFPFFPRVTPCLMVGGGPGIQKTPGPRFPISRGNQKPPGKRVPRARAPPRTKPGASEPPIPPKKLIGGFHGSPDPENPLLGILCIGVLKRAEISFWEKPGSFPPKNPQILKKFKGVPRPWGGNPAPRPPRGIGEADTSPGPRRPKGAPPTGGFKIRPPPFPMIPRSFPTIWYFCQGNRGKKIFGLKNLKIFLKEKKIDVICPQGEEKK